MIQLPFLEPWCNLLCKCVSSSKLSILGLPFFTNSLLKVWFRDFAFRNGVYQCQPPPHSSSKFEVRLAFFFPSLDLGRIVNCTGISHFPASSDVRCSARGRAECIQPHETGRELKAQNGRAARCAGVCQDFCRVSHLISDFPRHLRFSKLFMSHLDAEFQKQPISSLKSLVADQVGFFVLDAI